MSAITPDLAGDIKIDQHAFVTPPASLADTREAVERMDARGHTLVPVDSEQVRGVIRDLVLLPHARRRLRMDDPLRMSTLAQRFAPAQCVILDDGVRLDLDASGRLPSGARVVAEDGHIAVLEKA